MEEKQTAKAAIKAMEDFWVSEEYEEERAEYSANAYNAGRQSIQT